MRPRPSVPVLALVLAAPVACGPGDEPDDGIEVLAPRGQLIRLSMDLRGVAPAEEEIQAIEADPALYPSFVDAWLEDERFLERVREIWNARVLTRTGDAYFDPEEAGLAGMDRAEVADSVGDEPLRLLSWIVEHDRPLTEWVLAEHTVADEILAAMWDLDYPDGATGWQVATYRDGRPHAGLLTMTTTWQRYPSMGGNANRHRANAVSRILLCEDFLARPIVLDRAAIDQLTVDAEDAIADNPSCQSCHAALDPLAAHFFGFFHDEEPDGLRAATTYRPENEEGWRAHAGAPPAWYGLPTAGLREMALALADDPRFVECAVRTAMEGLEQRTLGDEDWEDLQRHRAVFVASGLRVKALFRSIVTSRTYLAARVADPALAARLPTVRKASPAQLASRIEDLTGYRWTFSGRDGLGTHDLGLPVLAGGIDGRSVTAPSPTPSVGVALVHERLAQAAAWHVAEHDLAAAREGEARLLRYVTALDTPEAAPEAFDAQIRFLYLRITGHPLAEDAPEPAALIALWKQAFSVEGTATAAWAAVVAAVLRDPRVLFY